MAGSIACSGTKSDRIEVYGCGDDNDSSRYIAIDLTDLGVDQIYIIISFKNGSLISVSASSYSQLSIVGVSLLPKTGVR